ncbi:MAG: hypothetical protein U9R79_12585 [Armatimonadota bacterium]|nr:hypothetical protein [Armatimonadota bacterium]
MSRRGGEDRSKDRLVWSVRRANESPTLCLLLIVFEIALGVGVYEYYGPYYAGFAVLFITLALLPFYGSYRYELGADGLEVHGPFYYAAHEWKDFDGWKIYEDDLRLQFRGDGRPSVLVLYAPRRLDAVVQYVQGHLPRRFDDD